MISRKGTHWSCNCLNGSLSLAREAFFVLREGALLAPTSRTYSSRSIYNDSATLASAKPVRQNSSNQSYSKRRRLRRPYSTSLPEVTNSITHEAETVESPANMRRPSPSASADLNSIRDPTSNRKEKPMQSAFKARTYIPPGPKRIRSTDVREVMRLIPSSVVVLTTRSLSPLETLDEPSESSSTPPPPSPPPSPRPPTPSNSSHSSDQWRGMTISSFTTLSLDPEPLITFNIKHPSRTLSAIHEHGRFLVHFLAGTNTGASIAQRFSENRDPKEIFDYLPIQMHTVSSKTKNLGLPKIHSKGILNVLECEVINPATEQWGIQGFTKISDHTLVIARVRAVLPGRALQQAAKKESSIPGVPKHRASRADYGLAYLEGDFVNAANFLSNYRAKYRAMFSGITNNEDPAKQNVGTGVYRPLFGQGREVEDVDIENIEDEDANEKDVGAQ